MLNIIYINSTKSLNDLYCIIINIHIDHRCAATKISSSIKQNRQVKYGDLKRKFVSDMLGAMYLDLGEECTDEVCSNFRILRKLSYIRYGG